MSKKVTIRDVAAAARVSSQTVSRVLNNRPDVARETRRRVLQVINALDYRPSAIARSLSRQHSHMLGVVTAGLKLIGPSRTLNGIAEQAEELGYGLLLKELPGFNTQNGKPVLDFMASQQVDGILWAVAEIGDNRELLLQIHNEISVPVVFLTMGSRKGLFTVAVDNELGGRMATKHLLAQGCRNIGHISGPLSWWESRQRKSGWHGALVEAGIPIEAHHWEEGDWSCASGRQAMAQILQDFPQMDAVFIANDQMALGALQLACERGIKVPDDIAVAGFDNLPESAYFWPSLTTVRQNLRRLGSTAVSELVNIIEARRIDRKALEPEAITLSPELIVRKSSEKRST